jgi:hypothetical protein
VVLFAGKAEPLGQPNSMRFRGDGVGRIPLPKDLSSRIEWLAGTDSVPAWLLLLSEGRFRLLSASEIEEDEILRSIRVLAHPDEPVVRAEPSFAEPADVAALKGKLLAITLRPHGQSHSLWRFSIPDLMETSAPLRCDPNDFVAAFREGYWEIWYTEAFKQAALGPLPALLRARRET